MSSFPAPWTILRDDDGEAIVVPEGTSVVEAVLTLIQEEFGGERFSEENPAVVAACKGVKVEVWRSCTKKYIETECLIEAEGYDGWWAPGGDGKRSIHVVSIDQSAYTLGEAALEHEPGAE